MIVLLSRFWRRHNESKLGHRGQSALSKVNLERSIILVFVGLYLVVFNRDLPHGDAMRIVAQIRADELLWNPNHLFSYPFGFYWYKALNGLGLPISELGSFEIISGVCTLVSLYLFHKILVELSVNQATTRVLLVVALFASNKFLSQAVSQYFHMLMMPFLMGALLMAVRYFFENKEYESRIYHLMAIGVLTAIPTTIKFNSVFLPGLIGFAIAWTGSFRSWDWRSAVAVWIPAALVGFVCFFSVYLSVGDEVGFVTWLTAYEGNKTLGSEIMVQLDPAGLAISGGRVMFHYLISAMVETGQLSTLLRALLADETIQYSPSWFSIALSAVVSIVSICFVTFVTVKALLRLSRSAFLRFLASWILAYLLFVFVWGTGGDAFWFQILPPLWIAAVLVFGLNQEVEEKGRQFVGMMIGVVALLIINTIQTVWPVAYSGHDKNLVAFNNIAGQCDLLVTPGWDHLNWITLDNCAPDAQRFLLREMALQHDDAADHIGRLRSIIDNELAQNGRIIVVRLYDLDTTAQPWYSLSRQGWARGRIQAELSGLCTTEVGRVDDVVVRQLDYCR